MIMNDTCATHRSRFPWRSSGRIKGGVTREDQAWTLFCVLCAAAAFILCLFILLLKSLNVRRFPPPSSRSTNFVTSTLEILLTIRFFATMSTKSICNYMLTVIFHSFSRLSSYRVS